MLHLGLPEEHLALILFKMSRGTSDHALTRTQDENDSYRATPVDTVSLGGNTLGAHAQKPENCRASVCIFCQVGTELQSGSE